jgi:hypothetical protein
VASILNDLLAFLRQPAVSVILYVVVAVAIWALVSRRYRVLVGTPVSALSTAVYSWLFPMLPAEPWAAFVEGALLFGMLTLFFAPIVIALDRAMRDRIRAWTMNRGAIVPYSVAVGAGLVAFLGSLAALYWSTKFVPGSKARWNWASSAECSQLVSA